MGIDGFNVLITVESALRGDPVYVCSDGIVRDLSLAYSSYKPSDKFEKAVILIKRAIEGIQPGEATIYLDSPVSGSGVLASRMRSILGEVAEVRTSKRVDAEVASHEVAASSDSRIISKASCVVDLPRFAMESAGLSPKPLFPSKGLFGGYTDW